MPVHDHTSDLYRDRFNVQWVEVKDGCSFCWYCWNCWPSLIKPFFIIIPVSMHCIVIVHTDDSIFSYTLCARSMYMCSVYRLLVTHISASNWLWIMLIHDEIIVIERWRTARKTRETDRCCLSVDSCPTFWISRSY